MFLHVTWRRSQCEEEALRGRGILAHLLVNRTKRLVSPVRVCRGGARTAVSRATSAIRFYLSPSRRSAPYANVSAASRAAHAVCGCVWQASGRLGVWNTYGSRLGTSRASGLVQYQNRA
eukprot:4599336-Prymnesium_polylepis.1